jgi:hypothetical protein
MSFMNFFDVNNEIKNLNNIITNLNKENNTLKDNFSSLNNTVNDVQMNKLDKVDIVNAVDEIKEELLIMNNKIDKIIRKQFLNEIDKMQENEVYEFLKKNNVDKNSINIILFLDFKTIGDLVLINVEDIKHYGIKEDVLEMIIFKAREDLGTFV